MGNFFHLDESIVDDKNKEIKKNENPLMRMRNLLKD